jgi:Domain of unknown function (DUF4390)
VYKYFINTICAVFLLTGTVYASDAVVDQEVFIFEDHLTVAFDFEPLFDQHRISRIKSGSPLYINLSVQLKKYSSMWFDPVLKEYKCLIKIEYQPFGSRCKIDFVNFEGEEYSYTYKTIGGLVDDLRDLLFLQSDKVENLSRSDNYYFCFNLELRGLTAKEISRAGDWYRGKKGNIVPKGEKLPEKAFRRLLDISGMGPEKIQFNSHLFKISHLRNLQP